MFILGISALYHDSTAAVFRDGELIAAAAEERFTGKKHDASWPDHAIEFCLNSAGINPGELDHIVFYEKPVLKFDRILDTHIRTWPFSYPAFFPAIPLWTKEKLKIRFIIKRKLGKYPLFVKHHISHAAGAFYLSGFKKAAVITMDGVGEWNTLSIGIGDANSLKILKTIDFPHSIGLLYSAITAFLGFKVNNGEGKIMGLASYGKATFKKEFEKLISIFPDGSFKLHQKYFAYQNGTRMFSRSFVKLFGKPRKAESEITERDENIAATLQWVLEETALKLAAYAKELTGADKLCMAGGVVLNSVMNGAILKSDIFKDHFFLPIGGDGGAALGGPLYLWRNVLGNNENSPLKHLFWGPGFSQDHIKNLLISKDIKFSIPEDPERTAAELISQKKIIAWFDGRMELGARALGHRSILADPRDPKMKDILNERVKHREAFRPFAPMILQEEFSSYFGHEGVASPYMILCLPVNEGRKTFPAAIHVDGSARVQTVNKEDNSKIYSIISHFKDLTDIPVILNTSFNVRGEPIVLSPEDALKTFLSTGIDHLFMEGILVDK